MKFMKNKNTYITFILLLVTQLCWGQVNRAEEVSVIYFEYMPFVVGKDSQPTGLSVDVLNAVAAKAGIHLKYAHATIPRAEEMLVSESVISPHLTRNAEREDKYVWVGLIMEDANCFLTLKEKKHISSLEEAKAFKTIGVNANGATEKFLRKNNFKNLEPMLENTLNARKLLIGRIDAWFTSKKVYEATFREEKMDTSKVVCDGKFNSPSYYIVASKKIPRETLAKLQKAHDELKKSGEIDKIISKY